MTDTTDTLTKPELHYCTPETAHRFADWLATRGGIAVWRSGNISNPGASWSTPALVLDGTPTPRPTWQAEMTPERIITDIALVRVSMWREVKRIKVSTRMGTQGLTIKLTDASADRLRQTLARLSRKHGKDTTYGFDYNTQEAVISVEDEAIPLADWLVLHPNT